MVMGLREFLRVVRSRLAVLREFGKDSMRYAKSSAPEEFYTSKPLSARSVEAQATKDYHRVEKGLALAQVKRPFGAALDARLAEALVRLPEGELLTEHVASARAALQQWNEQGSISEDISPHLPERAAVIPRETLSAFFRSRHSVRSFDPSREVSPETLGVAFEMAAQTPSVCNRQAWHAYIARTPETTRRLLGFQNGNRGFGDVPVVVLVTADLRLFSGAGERNQAWIDGSLFAMTLTWAMHGLGLATCMLNMSVRTDRADALRVAFGLREWEVPIMQIAVGYPGEGARVARSPRRLTQETLTYL